MNIIPWKNKGNGQDELPAREGWPQGADFDQLVQQFFDDPWAVPAWSSGSPADGGADFVPRLEMTETDEEVVLRVELPGIEPGKIDLHAAGDVLSISGEKQSVRDETRENFVLNERRFGRFERGVKLPPHVDVAAISADFEHGLLTVTMPRTADSKPRRIRVRSN